ncbi:MAG: methylenetetrahydrofolate--tRNA-(uracil(54)-C(5))-methyltransferase (FADH(2)-oxidizing) TrmFO [Polyangia bacterium]
MKVTVIGGGLAGCEAAWQLAERGVDVTLVEQKPARLSPAHGSPLLAELVCSNSLRGDGIETPAGLLKAELRAAGSLVLGCADATKVPAGDALAVDRHAFGRAVTVAVASHPRITLERRALDALPDGKVILAGGPLVGGGVERKLRALCGDRFYFYDAIAPIVDAESIDWDHAFYGSRYGKGDGADYVNCPLTKDEYVAFVEALRTGTKVAPHPFEEPRYFEGCLPVEIMAERGEDTLAFGPMKPVGLETDAYAVVQLRAESRQATSYNLVGFQTRLTYPEQKRVFSMIPALAKAEWVRFGSIHRNAYIESHRLLDEHFALRALPRLHLAGQITGVEGYIESTAIGLLVGLFIAGELTGSAVAIPPPETAFGALYAHALRPREPKELFQPSNINFGLMPPLPYQKGRHGKRDRRLRHVERARVAHEAWTKTLSAMAGTLR